MPRGVRVVTAIDDVGMVEVDPDRFAQIADNLLDNAMRYTPHEGTVTVRLYRTADVVHLEV